MQVKGQCHCGNIRYELEWPDDGGEIPVRECSCTFCVKHGGVWTSHREAAVAVSIHDDAIASKYSFGTKTATFHVCARCGAVPLVTSEIEGHVYAVVNVNTFHGVDRQGAGRLSFSRASTNFDGEDISDRLERRKRNWIPAVRWVEQGA